MSTGTDLEVPIENTSEQPFTPKDPPVGEMTTDEMLREVVRNQRLVIAQQAAILTMFQEIQGKVMEGGIGGLIKGMMGR